MKPLALAILLTVVISAFAYLLTTKRDEESRVVGAAQPLSEYVLKIEVTNTADTPIVPVTDYPCDPTLTNYTQVWATPDRMVGIWMNYIAPSNRQIQAQYARSLTGPWFARTPVWIYTNKDTQVMCGFPFQFYGPVLFCRTMRD